MLKKSFNLFLLLQCINAYAGTQGPVSSCQSEGVTVPCTMAHWDVAASAVYLKPTSALLDPIVQDSTPDGVYRIRRTVRMPNRWGFELEGSYYFNKSSLITLDWLNFYDTKFDTHTDNVQNYLSTNINIVNAEIGQKTHLGTNAEMRLLAGAQFASIGAKNTQITSSSSVSKYNGGGPRLGADFTQELPHGFNAFAQGAMSVLIGDGKGKQYSGTSQSVFNHKMQMVPSFDAKLGLGYQVKMQKGFLNVMGGWMFQNYFDVILMNDFKSTYNYSLNGPFIRAKWIAA